MICIQMGSILIKLLPRLLKIITFKTYCIIHSLGLFRYMYVHCVAVVANLKNIHNIHVNEPLEGAHANSDGQEPGGYPPPPPKGIMEGSYMNATYILCSVVLQGETA